MTRGLLRWLLLGLWALLLAFVGVASCEPSQEKRLREGSAIDGARIVAADREPGNWLTHGRTYSEQRHSPLEQINDGNVAKLGLAWYFDTGTDRGLEATPIVADGILYTTGSWSIVYAIDAATGKLLWRYDPQVPREWGRFACCDVVNRGVAVWKGKVYLGTLDGRLVALDAATGEVAWDVNTIDRSRPYTITGAPRVVKDKVLIGNGGAEYGVRGYFTAYDAETGKQLWRFYTVPGDPSQPRESPALERALKTWSGTWWEIGGGGTVWDSMAYDPELDLLYVGVGNGSPWGRHLRSPGGGDNLYLSSILAVRPDTGELVWHYQTTPGDTWDYTATQHIILADLELRGATRKVLMQAPKNGFFYVIDRETGELLSAEPYVKVTWARYIDSATGRPAERAAADWKDELKTVYPSPLGGHNWQPMAYNPETGLVYIPAMEIPGAYGPDAAFAYAPGELNTGLDTAAVTDVGPEQVAGHLLAWNPVAQKEIWRVPHGGPWNGGVLSTAGNLVFQGTGDGRFVAYRADTGEALWQAKAQTGVVAAPVTYTVNGEQYVSVMAGWGGSYALLFGRAAKAMGVQSFGRLLTFKLGGSVELPELAKAPPPPEPPPLSASPETVAQGEKLFHRHCVGCHGIGAVGGGVIADLRYARPEVHEAWNEIVLGGIYRGRGMAPFDKQLTRDGAQAIRAYVIKRAHEGDAPATAAPATSAPVAGS